jgi:DNA-directed RNA polymerase specialized sigma24 family protein
MVASRSSETSADASSRAPESGTPLVAGARVLEPMDFAELYRAQFSYVWKTARRLGVNAGEVDDVVQETFLTVHRLLDTYEPLGSVQSWLFSLLFRVVQRHRRSSLLAPLADAYEPSQADADRIFAKLQASLLVAPAAPGRRADAVREATTLLQGRPENPLTRRVATSSASQA